MSPRFLFIEEVRQALLSGAKVIEVPEGVRITSAARDLIREKGLKIQHVGPVNEEKARPESDAGDTGTVTIETSSGTGNSPAHTPDYSEDEIDAIVTRVIDRFYTERSPDQATARPPVQAADDDLIICRCEEITKGEIKDAIRNGMTTLNGVKRVTRAGMGLCQGQTCQRLVSRILAEELGVGLAEVEPVTARAPVRPIPLSVFATG